MNERERIEKEGRDRIQQLNEENEKLRQQIILDEELKQKQELESKGTYGLISYSEGHFSTTFPGLPFWFSPGLLMRA